MEGLKFESAEKPKYHYTYSDGRVLGNPILHQFDADDQFTADSIFYEYIQENNIDISQSKIIRGEIKN